MSLVSIETTHPASYATRAKTVNSDIRCRLLCNNRITADQHVHFLLLLLLYTFVLLSLVCYATTFWIHRRCVLLGCSASTGWLRFVRVCVCLCVCICSCVCEDDEDSPLFLVSQGNHVWEEGSDQKCRHVGGHAAGRRGVCHTGPGEVQHRERHRCIHQEGKHAASRLIPLKLVRCAVSLQKLVFAVTSNCSILGIISILFFFQLSPLFLRKPRPGATWPHFLAFLPHSREGPTPMSLQ